MGDPEIELADYIAKCRAMHESHVAPTPMFAHAVAALADKLDEAEQSRGINHAAANMALDQRDALLEALQRAADSFRSHGFAVDAEDCEEAIRSVRPSVQQSVPHASDCAVHNEPYKPAGPCNCNLADDAPTVEQLIAISEQQK